jgi:hypothetical protein
MKRIAAVVIVSGSIMAVGLPARAASPSAVVTIARTGVCTYRVDYTWSGLSGGAKLVAQLYLVSSDGTQDDFVFNLNSHPVSGRQGSFSISHIVTQRSASLRYYGYGFLQGQGGRVIRDSEDTSPLSDPESCP